MTRDEYEREVAQGDHALLRNMDDGTGSLRDHSHSRAHQWFTEFMASASPERVEQAVDASVVDQYNEFGSVGFDFMRNPQLTHRVEEIRREHIADPLLVACALVYLTQGFVKNSLVANVNNNVVLPMDFLIARPHITLRMFAACKTVYGANTRYLFEHQKFTFGHDAQRQVGTGAFTYRSRAIVDPRTTVWVPNVQHSGYVGGLDFTFFKDPNTYSHDVDAHICSAFSLPIPRSTAGARTKVPLTVSLNGVMPAYAEGTVAGGRDTLHYNTARYMAEKWRLDDEDTDSYHNAARGDWQQLNYVMSRGAQVTVDSNGRDLSGDLGTGALFQYISPGAAEVIAGKTTEFPNGTAYWSKLTVQKSM